MKYIYLFSFKVENFCPPSHISDDCNIPNDNEYPECPKKISVGVLPLVNYFAVMHLLTCLDDWVCKARVFSLLHVVKCLLICLNIGKGNLDNLMYKDITCCSPHYITYSLHGKSLGLLDPTRTNKMRIE